MSLNAGSNREIIHSHAMQSFKNVPNDYFDNTDVLVPTAKTRQSEQGALKRGGIDLLVMPPKLKGRLPLWRVCSVKRLRRLVKRRNLVVGLVAVAVAGGLFVVVRIARIA